MTLIKGNTDKMCLKESKNPIINWINLFLYRFIFWTGIALLEPAERVAALSIEFLLIAVTCMYAKEFLRGLVDGFLSVEEDSLMKSFD